MVRKQLNLSLTLEQYKWLEELAQEAGETPTKYARHIVLDAISPAPETDLNSGVLAGCGKRQGAQTRTSIAGSS